MILHRDMISETVKFLLRKYDAEYAMLFGSYARGDCTEESDVDLVVFGGERFDATDIFAFAEELFRMLKKPVDVYEIREINRDTVFYENILSEGVKIAG